MYKYEQAFYLTVIEEFASPDSEQDFIIPVINDIVSTHWGKRLSVHAEGASFQLDDVLLEDDVAARRNFPA